MKIFKHHPAYLLMLVAFDLQATSSDRQEVLEFPISNNQTHNDPAKPEQQPVEELQAFNIKNFVTFNAKSLFGESNRNLNLSTFSKKNYIPQSVYTVQVNINDKAHSEISVRFDNQPNFESARLCLEQNLIEKIDLKQDILTNLPKSNCLRIEDIASEATYTFDLSKLVLDIYIPQAFINERTSGYIDPKLFNKGVTSAFLTYQFNTHYNEEDRNQYLNLDTGINLAGWYFRHQGNFDSNGSGLGKYNSNENVLYTDILPWHSRLSIGQFSTQNYQVTSLPIVGVQIASDQSMLPWSERQYSPVIENIANSNAVVKVYQNGNKIYERTVPAGPFRLTDLNSVGSGQLLYEIVEMNGDIRTYTMHLQSNAHLIKAGQYQYSASTGRYRLSRKMTDEWISQFNFGYGLNNYLTLLGGINYSEHYQSALIGLGLSTALGSINIKTNASDAHVFSEQYKGQQYNLDYQYTWPKYDFSVSLNQNYQSRNFLSATNTLSRLNYDELTADEQKNYLFTNNLKQQYSIGISKSNFLHKNAGFNLNYSTQKYWDDQKTTQQYTVAYSNSWKKIGYTLGYSQTDYSHASKADKTVYLNFSLPLDWKKNRIHMNSNIQHIRNTQPHDIANINLSGQLGDQNNFYYGVGLSHTSQNNENNTAIQANATYMRPQVTLGATAFSMNNQQQYSFSAQGALVAHRYGVTATNTLSDTFTIIHADGARGAKVNNAWGIKLDRFGNAIYSNNTAYSENSIQINTEDLPIDITLESNKTTVIPRKYSSSLAKFGVKRSSNILLRIQSNKITHLPIGSRVLNTAGDFVGMLAQSNQVIIEQPDDIFDQYLTVSWGNDASESCTIPSIPVNTPNSKKTTYHFEIIKVECN